MHVSKLTASTTSAVSSSKCKLQTTECGIYEQLEQFSQPSNVVCCRLHLLWRLLHTTRYPPLQVKYTTLGDAINLTRFWNLSYLIFQFACYFPMFSRSLLFMFATFSKSGSRQNQEKQDALRSMQVEVATLEDDNGESIGTHSKSARHCRGTSRITSATVANIHVNVGASAVTASGAKETDLPAHAAIEKVCQSVCADCITAVRSQETQKWLLLANCRVSVASILREEISTPTRSFWCHHLL